MAIIAVPFAMLRFSFLALFFVTAATAQTPIPITPDTLPTLRDQLREARKADAQAAIDGWPEDTTQPLLDSVLKPLWEAYHALKIARTHRAPLELDLPERKLILDAHGLIERVVTPDRLDAHKLVEEFMIQANVAAAEELLGDLLRDRGSTLREVAGIGSYFLRSKHP